MLVTSVIDTKFAAGGVGIRGDAFATLDDFAARLVTTTLPFNDPFTLPDNAPLGINWTHRLNGFKVTGSKARGTAAAVAANIATLVGVHRADIELQADVDVQATTNHTAGLIARYAGPGDANYYEARISRTSTGFLASIMKGTTTLKKVAVGAGAGTLKFNVFGSTLQLFINNVLLLTATDTALGSGGAGMRIAGASSIDSFTATALTTALPFNETFNQAVNSPLNAPWAARIGNYVSTGTAAKGTTSLNVATLAGVNVGDVDITANIVLPTVGQFASLLARSTGPGDNNCYSATVMRTATGFTATIVKKVNNVLTTLGSINVAAVPVAIRFKLAGNQLQCFVNGVLHLTRFDSSLTSGTVGIRSSKDATFDNFDATL